MLFITKPIFAIKGDSFNIYFGGKGAKAAIVTTEPCNAAARHRAAQLGIAVIDLEELRDGHLVQRLKIT